MTRLDGEKKSPLPWIIGLLVLALLAAAIYYFAFAKGNTDGVDTNAPVIISNAPGGMGMSSDNSVDTNIVDTNMVDTNMTDTNMADANMADANMADANMADGNSAMMGTTDGNMTDTNAMSDANATFDNNAMAGSGTMMDNSASALPALTPASAPAKPASDGIIATRSKTVKSDDKTVIYQKSVAADGKLTRNKKIVAEPVKEAKKP